MALTDLVLSVIPEAYRRDVMVLAIGATAATGWWHFESRIDTAYAAAVTTQQQQVQLQQLTANQKLIEAQSATNQSNIAGMKTEVDALVLHLLNQQPTPTAPPVTAKKKMR